MKRLNPNYEKVIALLAKEGGFTRFEYLNTLILYNVLKKPKKNGAYMLRRLETEYGYLQGDATGTYRLTEEGQKYLDNLKS